MVPPLKYLGILLSSADDDCPVVIRNLTKARAVWRRILKILSREGVRPRVSGFFFKASVQSVLLFGEETWVVTPRIGRVMGSFQHQVVRRLTSWLPHRRSDGRWEYISAETAREEAEFEPIETYIRRRQSTVTQYIATRTILDLWKTAERKWGAREGMQWWRQAVLDLAGVRETAAEAEE